MHKVENKKTRYLNIPEIIESCPEICSGFFCICLTNILKISV